MNYIVNQLMHVNLFQILQGIADLTIVQDVSDQQPHALCTIYCKMNQVFGFFIQRIRNRFFDDAEGGRNDFQRRLQIMRSDIGEFFELQIFSSISFFCSDNSSLSSSK